MKPEVGKTHGFRKAVRTKGQPLVPANVVKLGPPKSKQVRVRWLSGAYEGMEEWINHLCLVCSWGDRDTFLQDEMFLLRVVENSYPCHDEVEDRAVNEVFGALEPSVYTEYSSRKNNVLVIDRFSATMAGLRLDAEEWAVEPFSYVNSIGTYYGTFATATKLAQRLGQLYPERVLRFTREEILRHNEEAQTSQYLDDDPWNRNPRRQELATQFLREQEQVTAIVHFWCGEEPTERQGRIEELEHEVARPRELLASTLDRMQGTAQQHQLSWLRAKYVSTYRQLTGSHPAGPKSTRAKNRAHDYAEKLGNHVGSVQTPPCYWVRVSQAGSTVELWSTARLPFEPNGWLRQMRDELREAIRQLRPQTENPFLEADLVSADTEYFDTENVLLYNVGVANFKHLCLSGISFRRSVHVPPDCPVTLDGKVEHYYVYQVRPKSVTPAAASDQILAEWKLPICPPLSSSTKPHVVWHALRQLATTKVVRKTTGTFGLYVTLTMPRGTVVNVAGFIKPLLDGIVSAFHTHDGSDLSTVANRLSSLTGLPSHGVEALLMKSPTAVFGKTRLVYPRGPGVQWSPNDHLCTEATLNVDYVDDTEWTMSGHIYDT